MEVIVMAVISIENLEKIAQGLSSLADGSERENSAETFRTCRSGAESKTYGRN